MIYYSDQTFQSFQQVQCASGRIPYALSHGNLPKQWTGLDNSLIDLQNITFVLENYYENTTEALWENTDWLDTDLFGEQLAGYFENYSEHTVANPNPSKSTGVVLDYTKKLGPLNDSSTYAGSINAEYTGKVTPVIITMSDLKNISKAAISYISEVVATTKSSNSSLSVFVTGNQEINRNIDTWILNNEENIKTSWRGFTFAIVIWGWFICIGVLITVYSQAMVKPFLAHGLCCFWLFTGIIAVLGFLASAGSLAAGLVTQNSCGLLDDLFTKEGLSTYGVIIPSEIVVYIDTCLNNGGDMSGLLNLTVALGFIQELANDNKTLGKYLINENLGKLSTIQSNIAKLSSPINYLTAVSSSELPEDSPFTNLNLLTSYTNNLAAPTYQSVCTSHTQDKWVFSQTSCGDYPYIPSTSPTASVGSKCCLVVEEWTSSQVNQRYNPYLTCDYDGTFGNYYQTIDKYQTALFVYRFSVYELYGEMTGKLTALNQTSMTMASKLTAQYSKVTNYFNSPNQLLYLMNSGVGKTGLINNLNCSFVHEYSLSLKQAMCTNSVENIYEVFVFIFVLSFFMLLLELINLYLSRALLKGEEVY